MAFDYSMLRKRIREVFGNVTEFCNSCRINEVEFLKKVNNKKPFSTDEVILISDVLHVSEDEIKAFFFTKL